MKPDMKIVLTNDDGVHAPGLETLLKIAQQLGTAIVVAPKEELSGVAHRVTKRSPIKVEELSENRFRITGTPADCARVALKHIAPDADWVLSGINPGANLGSDVYNSGTVAAAREAAILGCRGIAVSQYISRDRTIDWDSTRHHAEIILRMLMTQDLPDGYFWNINLPHPLDHETPLSHEFCDLDINPHRFRYREEPEGLVYEGIIHDRPRTDGRDVAVCFGGKVSITRIGIGTCDETLAG